MVQIFDIVKELSEDPIFLFLSRDLMYSTATKKSCFNEILDWNTSNMITKTGKKTFKPHSLSQVYPIDSSLYILLDLA